MLFLIKLLIFELNYYYCCCHCSAKEVMPGFPLNFKNEIPPTTFENTPQPSQMRHLWFEVIFGRLHRHYDLYMYVSTFNSKIAK